MEPEFDWNDANIDHIARHSVSPQEAEEALLDPQRLVRLSDQRMAESRWTALGATDAGRVLAVVFTRRYGMVRVIAAREAEDVEKRRYRRGHR